MTPAQKAVDSGAAISIGSFSISLASATEMAQFIAAIVAIIAGLLAIVAHIRRRK